MNKPDLAHVCELYRPCARTRPRRPRRRNQGKGRGAQARAKSNSALPGYISNARYAHKWNSRLQADLPMPIGLAAKALYESPPRTTAGQIDASGAIFDLDPMVDNAARNRRTPHSYQRRNL